MAAVKLIALHQNKGKSLAATLHDRTDYASNPEKTEKGKLVSSYQCDPFTVDEDFLISKRMYEHMNGRQHKGDIIAYQIRQSFKPGEISPEEANRLGHELAQRFTKGKFAYIVATHTDRAHIHNHVIFNSTAIDGTRKFRNFWFSGLALQRLSDIICLENGLSVIQRRPYNERNIKHNYPKKESNRDVLCSAIKDVFKRKPQTFDDFLNLLQEDGYEIKRGKSISVKGKSQKRFIRLNSLPKEYREDYLRGLFSSSTPEIVNPFEKRTKADSIIELQNELIARGPRFVRWTSTFNVNQIARTLEFGNEHRLYELADYQNYAANLITKKELLLESVTTAEARLSEIAALKKHIVNYRNTKDVYITYRKAGYSKKFLAAHKDEIEMHRRAKEAFDKLPSKKLPTLKELNAEYTAILTQKKSDYAKYRKLPQEIKEAQIFAKNYAIMVGTKPEAPQQDKKRHTKEEER